VEMIQQTRCGYDPSD